MNMKRILALGLAAVMSVSCIACGNGKTGGANNENAYNGGKEVEIKYWNSGMGTEYLDKMVAAFNAKQSEWYVKYDATASQTAVASTYGIEDADTTDLYIAGLVSDTSYMEPLDELLESTADGDAKTLGEKFHEGYLETERASDGHIYTLTNGGGVLGIVYNRKLFEKVGIDTLPRTTDELAVACDKLMSADITPLTHFQDGGYWKYFWEAWRSQYEGNENYRNFCAGASADGNSDMKTLLTTKDGRYQVLKVLEKLLTPEYVLNGANSSDHTTMQTMFLNSDIGMMINGAWMANEMAQVGNMEDYGVLKTPVISSIKDKLTTVKNDKDLRELVSAIDAVIDGEAEISTYQSGDNYLINGKEVSAADWEFVKEARLTVPTCYSGQNNFIPTYSDAKEGAMEFLKFYYSDEGYEIYANTTKVKLPMDLSEGTLDTSEWNIFETQINGMLDTAMYTVSNTNRNTHPIFIAGGAPVSIKSEYVARFCTNNAIDRMTADDVWDDMVQYVEKNYDNWMANIK